MPSTQSTFSPHADQPGTPTLVVTERGTIRHSTPEARRLLALGTEADSRYVFDLVAPEHLLLLMQDVSEVSHGRRQRASRLIRLKTEANAWQLCRVHVVREGDRQGTANVVLQIQPTLHS